MSKLRLVLLLGVALLFGGQSLFAQSKKEKKEQKELEVKEMIEGGRFAIDVNRAVPMSGRAINLNSSYSLELNGDSVVSFLPYYGKAYSVPYGGGNSMDFKTTFSEYDLSYNKKGTATMKFRARTDDDTYAFTIEVFSNGSSTIRVTPVNKQGIIYYGELAPKKKEQ